MANNAACIRAIFDMNSDIISGSLTCKHYDTDADYLATMLTYLVNPFHIPSALPFGILSGRPSGMHIDIPPRHSF